MKRRLGAALLILAVASCRRAPDDLYAQGRDAILRGELETAQKIARDGEKRFANQPQWLELFSILEAEAVGRTDAARVKSILQRTPKSGQPLPTIRRLIFTGDYAQADVLAARFAPQLRPEIAMRRILDDKQASARANEAIKGATALRQTWVVASAYNFLAVSDGRAGRWSDAIDHARAALTNARTAKTPLIETSALNNLGWAYMNAGDLDQALQNLNAARSIAQEHHNQPLLHHALSLIAEVYERRIELDEALRYATQAQNAATNPRELANAYYQLAQIRLELGDYTSAEKLNAQARQQRPEAHEDDRRELFLEARLRGANGNPASALDMIEELLTCYDHLDDPTRWRAQGIAADMHARLGHFADAERMYKAALATATDARARVAEAASLAFERNLLGFYDSYIQLLLDEKRPTDALLVAESSRARTLKNKIRWTSDVTVDPRALAHRRNATILCYWLGATRSLLWSVTPDGVDVATLLPDEALDRAADEYLRELTASRRKPLESAAGARLYELLLGQAKITTHRVIILPDAHLNAIPFEALIVRTPAPHYWIQDVTISYSPSLRLLAARPERTTTPPAGSLLVFGDVPSAGPQYPALKGAGKEIDDIARHFDRARCEIVRGIAATPASYLASNPSRFRYIHFAAHGYADPTEPLESSVILAGGALKGKDIIDSKHPLAAELVTISSCNSAGRRSYAGEGLVGLAWAFLGAGAHRVVAAQWEVSDAIAAKMMDAMYGAIAGGADPAEALRTAKLALLRSNDVQQRPVYWAPFVIYEAM